MSLSPASIVTRPIVVEHLREHFRDRGRRSVLDTLASSFEAPALCLLFGGVIRNAVLRALDERPFPARDLDFVVFGLPDDQALHQALGKFKPRRNSFGGLKAAVGESTCDIWRAELQLSIAGQPPVVTTIPDFLQCVTLTTDAVLYDPRNDTVHEEGFLEAINTRTISIGTRSHWVEPWIHYHLAHLAYVRALTGFALSTGARDIVRRVLTERMAERAAEYLASRHKCDDPVDAVDVLARESGM